MLFSSRLKKIGPELDSENSTSGKYVAGPVNPFVPVRRRLPEIHLICITTPLNFFEICPGAFVDLVKQEARESNSMDRSDKSGDSFF